MFLVDLNRLPSVFSWFPYGFVRLPYGFAMFLVDLNRLPSPDLWCSLGFPMVLQGFWLIWIVCPRRIFCFLMVFLWLCNVFGWFESSQILSFLMLFYGFVWFPYGFAMFLIDLSISAGFEHYSFLIFINISLHLWVFLDFAPPPLPPQSQDLGSCWAKLPGRIPEGFRKVSGSNLAVGGHLCFLAISWCLISVWEIQIWWPRFHLYYLMIYADIDNFITDKIWRTARFHLYYCMICADIHNFIADK